MIYLELLDKNPLSIQPIIAKEYGFFEKNGVQVKYEMVKSFPAFDMSKVTANVGDTTRIFERISNGEQLIITSDLTRTMKLILCNDYQTKRKLKILAANEQSLGIYTEYFMNKNNLKFEYVVETSFEKRIEMLKKKEVDGACMIDPFLIQFINNGYTLVYDGKDHKNNYTCWAFHKKFEIENPGIIKKFHKSLNEATKFWNELLPEQKLQIANKYLDTMQGLDDYYQNFKLDIDREYSIENLKTCLEWKQKKTNITVNNSLEEIIYKW